MRIGVRRHPGRAFDLCPLGPERTLFVRHRKLSRLGYIRRVILQITARVLGPQCNRACSRAASIRPHRLVTRPGSDSVAGRWRILPPLRPQARADGRRRVGPMASNCASYKAVRDQRVIAQVRYTLRTFCCVKFFTTARLTGRVAGFVAAHP